MRQTRTIGPATFAVSSTPPWLKMIFIAEASLFFLALIALWSVWEDAQKDLAYQQKQLKTLSAKMESDRRDQENAFDYLRKYDADPEFRLREGRERLGLVGDGEIVFRIDGGPAATASTAASAAPTPAPPPPTPPKPVKPSGKTKSGPR